MFLFQTKITQLLKQYHELGYSNSQQSQERHFYLRKGKNQQQQKCELFDWKIRSEMLRTGLHIMQEIKCIKCKTYLGWKYLHAYEQSEKQKEGKIILETLFLTKIKWN
ncbi:unnamed protein product (macronuclear) [Paramecium tetraurelia]|uniref:Yippee domain-containing protein n=1 Tax=Paramecium tetraurelia TaxID=5888 RepID=A0D671_PARTE|nr:uncharacterized protein GSPATT00013968001 [Paramecium tetraurelia]CAK78538.1 unnamed protein product [Paramecium tetraurelia]|eukprot:XP_001445935.1 hypothetical protein (macronuclear) [Paramecium tetraurelia strain d4-2]